MSVFNPSLRTAAIIANGLLTIGIVHKFINEARDFGNPRAWLWLAVIIGCPLLNLIGLFKIWVRVTPVLAAVYNGCAICVWGFLIFLMMVWPMGAKPKGLDLVILPTSWLILLLTEAVLIRLIIPKAPSEAKHDR